MLLQRTIIFLFISLLTTHVAFADIKYQPIRFSLSTEKESYYEGEKINFIVAITNTDKENTYPVLVPHTQNTGQKLFYLNAYDKANNTMLLRYSEDRILKMMVHDTGNVQIKYLKPQEEITMLIHLNDFDNYYNYQTQNSSHHSFGVPLFAGIYKVNIVYNPNGIALGDSIYNYYNNTEMDLPINGRLPMPSDGDISNLITLKIKRNSDTIVSIEDKKYYIKTDGYRYFYFNENVKEIISDLRLIHSTSLPPDSCSLPTDEYFYSHFTDLYAEYISRFNDGDIREYRKYSDYCPDYLYTEKYNEFKQKILYELQLPDKRFYSVSYGQPGNKKHQETYCSADGTLCNVTTYIYDKKGEFVRSEITQTQPCIEVELNGKKRSYKDGILRLNEH